MNHVNHEVDEGKLKKKNMKCEGLAGRMLNQFLFALEPIRGALTILAFTPNNNIA